MAIVINYKNKLSKNKSNNETYFVNEKYDLSDLKKYFKTAEYKFIFDIVKTYDLSKKSLVFILILKKEFF